MTYQIIDVHAHLGDWHHYAMEEDVDALIRMMDLVGIERVCLNHLFGGDPVYSNGCVHTAMSRHPDRVVGFATLNLHYPEETDAELRRCFDELGMKGIKVYPPHHGSVDRPVYDPVFAFARERRAPVLCHTFPGELAPLGTVAEKFPEVAFILGHAGGTEDGFDRAIELAKQQPNIYLEICHSRRIFGLIERFVREVGSDRILFGSDYSLLDPRIALGRVMYADITPEERANILGRNARRLLKL